MKIIIVSDSHGNTLNFDAIIEQHQADIYLHAGDFAADSEIFRLKTGKPTFAVLGNTDRQRNHYKPDEYIEIDGFLLWLTHGNKYLGYNSDCCKLITPAQEIQADIVVFGHTHIAKVETQYNITFINPGSISYPRDIPKPSFAVLELQKGEQPKVNIYRL